MTKDNTPSLRSDPKYFLTLSLTALGVVYGDIGTSPLYALRECFTGHHPLEPTITNVYGILSLIFWSLIIVVTFKYLLYVMRADNQGEGGVLALTALASSAVTKEDKGPSRSRMTILFIGLFGSALLYGDGIITPAITVLSAVEGLTLATPNFAPYVVPLTVVILVFLFLLQRQGTARIGAVFGPVILLWFFAIGALGIRGVIHHPSVLYALNPWHAVQFFMVNGHYGFLALGAVVLVVTGGEALYADMGHFGKEPIRFSWFAIVLPCLMLNYLGQGAILLEDPTAAANPFYKLAPTWALYPLVALATMAAIIASQALISAAFSLTRQAVQLGFLPRIEVSHTSEKEIGQIYVSQVNWALLGSTVWLVLTFKTSSSLAAAYGIAVTGTMVITTGLIYFVARHLWRWRPWTVAILTVVLLSIDLAYLAANITKIHDGGWVPLAIAAVIMTMMTTWRRGREILAQRMTKRQIPLERYLKHLQSVPPLRVPGVGIFMTSNIDVTPPALDHNVRHNKILHDKVIIMMVTTEKRPHVPWEHRLTCEPMADGIFKIVIRYGFMDTPNIPAVLLRASLSGLAFKPTEATYFLGRETLLSTKKPGMAIWREKLFAVMARNAQRATAFFHLPPNQVVEIGMQVEL